MAKLSLRKAINEYCKDCGHDPLDSGAGSWLKQITDCEAVGCPLFPVRPLTKEARLSLNGKAEVPEGIKRYQKERNQ